MCGLFGFSRYSEVAQQLLGVLAVYMNNRGEQSFGWTDGEQINKRVGSILDHWQHPDILPTAPLLVHTRAASVGAVSQANAHPFEWLGQDDHRVIGAHNGHVSNWHVLKQKYSATRHAAEVDSQQIFATLAERTPLEEVEAWGTAIWFERRQGAMVGPFLSTFARGDLAIAKLVTGEIVFASTRLAIERAVRLCPDTAIEHFYDVVPKMLYEIRGDVLYQDEKLPWGERPLTYTSSQRPPIIGFNGSGESTGIKVCRMPTCNNKLDKPSEQLICTKCYDEIMTIYCALEEVSPGEAQWSPENSQSWRS
jgi:hypothetical protein